MTPVAERAEVSTEPELTDEMRDQIERAAAAFSLAFSCAAQIVVAAKWVNQSRRKPIGAQQAVEVRPEWLG